MEGFCYGTHLQFNGTLKLAKSGVIYLLEVCLIEEGFRKNE